MNLLPAYCFYQQLDPRPPLEASFDRDYLLYAIAGALRLELDEGSWLLPPSFAAWIPAHTPMIVVLDQAVTSCSVLTQEALSPSMPRAPRVFQMSALARRMIHHCRRWGPDDPQPEEAKHFFLALLGVCAELLPYSVDVQRPSAADPIVMRALEVTEERLSEPLRFRDIARAVHRSERSLQRQFVRCAGLSWSAALRKLRMIRAVELLSSTDYSVLRVAGECGYASVSAFNRAFLDAVGATPTDFRRALED